MLVDEIEAAMHPGLLSKIADAIAGEVRKDKQVIVAAHSLEAVYMLVAALLGDVEVWRRQDRLMELLNSACQVEEDKLESLYAIHILNREVGL